ncbi:uncharacterized protein LOC6564774 isoform X2 [Drosophila grimshawi]|uniref:uncharacterized protein LOC6564774 isoform X2 n=1 Tax=Drosophila grimshawi TaxID=7222 RepID=UPI001C936F24|nr:uncharacterized protein LOC6564774 isoform X2 [Drosophila grimshawi]
MSTKLHVEMKTNQIRTAAASAAKNAASSYRLTNVRQLSREEELSTRLSQRQRQSQPTCERERKHEAARKEREAKAQHKRDAPLRGPTSTTPTLTPTQTQTQTSKSTTASTGPLQKSSKEKEKQLPAAKAGKQPIKLNAQAAKANNATSSVGPETNYEDTTQLRLQLEHLAQLSEPDFERQFRKWMSEEGIENQMHSQLRVELINRFNSTSLGKLLNRASATAAQMGRQSNCLLPSPIMLALHTLVAEFLYEQNCHYTLSVFCSEMPHHHTLPKFQGRTEFRFNREELQQLLTALMGKKAAEQTSKGETVQQLYSEQPQQSLLLIVLKALLEFDPQPRQSKTEAVQTEPLACLEISKEMGTSQLYEADELIGAADGRTVFIGPHASQLLNDVGQQLSQLMQHICNLSKSCAPPIEIISTKAFEQLLQLELVERQRLTRAGRTLGPGQMVTQLPVVPRQHQEVPEQDKLGGTHVLSSVGPIELPVGSASVPELPHLHAEQVATLAIMHQTIQKFKEQMQQPSSSVRVTLERWQALMGELTDCVQVLSNVLNLSMEQECLVGRHQGYKQGYREGFSHGHFMGVQEGKLLIQPKTQQLLDTASQTQVPRTVEKVTQTTETKEPSRRHATTNTDCRQQSSNNVASQTQAAGPVKSRSYVQWIYEMLHSKSGRIFLDRVELSLNKALMLQKQRLDELYKVKLRHHVELIYLSIRQSSWRTLCKHVESDSHSPEMSELVQKIFHLLEHYEAHHQLLAEKIQQTEIAAQQAVRIQPVWTETELKPCTTSKSKSSLNSPKAPLLQQPPLPLALDPYKEPHATAGTGERSAGAELSGLSGSCACPHREDQHAHQLYPRTAAHSSHTGQLPGMAATDDEARGCPTASTNAFANSGLTCIQCFRAGF